MTTPQTPHPVVHRGTAGAGGVAAVILAAGASTRMGTPKQLLTLDGRTLIARTIQAAQGAGCHPILVVLGAHADQIRPELAGLPCEVLQNPAWAEGMASSIQIGLQALQDRPGTDGVILTVCDQPYVSAEHLRALAQAARSCQRPIVASQYAGILGVPAFFAPALWPELLALHGEAGARQVIRQHVREVYPLPFAEGACDLDTPEDLLAIGAQHFDAPPPARH
jgi:molybdenum cofactor cytidylyltransferase